MRLSNVTSIRFKLRLIIMSTIIIALLMIFSSFLIFEATRSLNVLAEEMQILAKIAANRSTAAILFDDTTSASETLAAISEKQSITAVVIFKPSGKLFSEYYRDSQKPVLPDLPALSPETPAAFFFKNKRAHLFYTIELSNRRIGIIYLQSDMKEINSRFFRYAGIASIFVLISLLLAYLLSIRLQKSITGPVTHLVNTVQTVSAKKDYSIRARKENDDELGMLIDSFNEMLNQIQLRDRELLDITAAQARLISAINQAQELIMLIDLDGNIKYANTAVGEFTSQSVDNLINKNMVDLEKTPESRKKYQALWDIILKEKEWSGHITRQKVDGASCRMDVTISPIRDTDGNISGFVSIARDITKEMALEEQLRQAQKMEAIGTLAGGIAHDFNNILAAIIGYTELAKDNVAPDSPAEKSLDQVLKSSFRARDLVSQILAFSRKNELAHKPTDINASLQDIGKLLRATIPSTIKIKTDLNADPSMANADPIQLHQVFLNLCTNAAQAMEANGGTLTLKTTTVALNRADNRLPEAFPPGQYIKIEIIDTGVGIDQKIMGRIFEPFFTTKEQGKGTGMGLAVAHGIIKNHNGCITLESEKNRGTAFTLLLPAISMQPPEKDEPQTVSESLPQGNNERILFVDDEPLLVDLGKNILQSLGYTVTTAEQSLQALKLFRKNPDAFDLVVTDQTMPEMTGDKLSQEILKIRPGLPVILCTGYSETVSPEQAKLSGINHYLIKPVNKKLLAETIRKVLDNP